MNQFEPAEESFDEKEIADIKEIFRDAGQEITDDEAMIEGLKLRQLANMFFDMYLQEEDWKDYLLKEPDGFSIAGNGRRCWFCESSQYAQEMWYDKCGLKCTACQDALKKKVIPRSLFNDKDRKRHTTASRLALQWRISKTTLNKLVRQKKLIARIIPQSGVMVFLEKENPGLARTITEERIS